MHMTTLFCEINFNYCILKVVLSEIHFYDIVAGVVFTSAKGSCI
jgi:hypothetical protein